jgi:hypothetical protein
VGWPKERKQGENGGEDLQGVLFSSDDERFQGVEGARRLRDEEKAGRAHIHIIGLYFVSYKL